MKQFVKVSGQPCTPQLANAGHIRENFLLNIDMIVAIINKRIYIKGADAIKVGSKFYKDIILDSSETIN